MAVRIDQYEQRTSPSGLGVTPAAHGQHFESIAPGLGALANAADNAAAVAGQKLREAEAEKKRQQDEDARVWSANAAAQAQQSMLSSLVDAQDHAESGAPEFTKNFNSQFDKYENELLGNAPNDTSRRFLQERMRALRADLSGKALGFEADERRKWRVSTMGQAIEAASATVAMDSSRLPVVRAEQRAIIEAMEAPPAQKRVLLDKLDNDLSVSAVQGDIQRDPLMARAHLADRVGVHVDQVSGASVDSVWERMIHRESGGQQFKDGKPTTSSKGATGIAQVMPATGPEAAKLAGLPWDEQRFKTDASYNLALGRAYYDAQLAEFGSPALAAAAYNAGPDAVQGWIKRFGDPRKGEISVADFSAKIPYKETREYVAAVAPPSLTVAEAVAAKPEGQKTGVPAYDMLTVPQVIQMLGQTNSAVEKQQAQVRAQVETRAADDLAAYGDGKAVANPITAGEFVDAYGVTEGTRRFAGYQQAQRYAADVSQLSTMTPAQIASAIKAKEPKPGDGYAVASKLHGAYVNAARQVLRQRDADPIAYAGASGLGQVGELNPGDPARFAAELKNRAGLAATMADKFGTRYTLLTTTEADGLTQQLQGYTAPEKSQFLASVRGALSDERSYHAIMAQLRPDSPVTAMAGSLLALPAATKVEVAAGGMFRDAQTLTAAQVAQKLLIGEDLLNPTKDAKGNDGKPKFPMPSETDLRATWTDYTGAAYAGAPDTEAATYQAFRAYYAAEAARAGKYDGVFDPKIAAQAARAVTGGVADVGASTVVLPYGMDEGAALDKIEQAWDSQRVALGLPAGITLDKIGLQTIGNGVYAVSAGTGPLRDATGRPVTLRIGAAAAGMRVAGGR